MSFAPRSRFELPRIGTGSIGGKARGLEFVASYLDQKELVVRGQVIKINRDIMNRNWVHIMDGTKGLRSDLTFTTQEDFQIGDTVTVKGTIAVDKEYGAGYVYPVILEDAVRY